MPPGASVEGDAQVRLQEDADLLARWTEELEERQKERLRIQARHRDQLDDALDHLEDLRKIARERGAEESGDPSANPASPQSANPSAERPSRANAQSAQTSGGTAGAGRGASSADAGAQLDPLSASSPNSASSASEAPAGAFPDSEAPADEPVRPFTSEELASYRLPSLDHLRPPSASEGSFVGPEELEENKRRLQDVLDSFAIDAFVHDAIVGPRVTQFRVRPGFGVRVEAIASLDRNIALAMSANAVRIQAPIPGESYVGVEIPNRNAAPLALRGSLESDAWRGTGADIPLVFGIDIAGRLVLCDLAKAPHALIAGATGSGKSVCISNLILSLIYRFRPDELELVLIDPKIVEFAIYRDLPHLIHPVVTDSKQACQALKWLVREMERRYAVLAEKGVRNISGYNAKAAAGGFPKLPFIVLIIDELADLMMTAAADVETPIARLAQMSRAVGIHTVLATQRPSVNVITGVIKANYPTRIAFQVASQVDSRTILDSKGAEALQGRGDMLYCPPGLGRLQRLQAPFVDDAEIERVVSSLKAQLQPRYRVELRPEDAPGGGAEGGAEGEGGGAAGADPMLKEALGVLATHGRASTSYLQRRLKIGYNRAASLMEELERRRYIGPQVGNNPREIYVQPEDLNLD